MAPPQRTSDNSSLLIYRPPKDQRLSWLTCSGRFTHISGHPSAAGRAQDREISPVKDRRSTTVLRYPTPSYGTDQLLKLCGQGVILITEIYRQKPTIYGQFSTNKYYFVCVVPDE